MRIKDQVKIYVENLENLVKQKANLLIEGQDVKDIDEKIRRMKQAIKALRDMNKTIKGITVTMLSSEKTKNAEDDNVEMEHQMENQMPQKENSKESFNMFKK